MYEVEHQKLIIKWATTHPICKDYLLAIPNGMRCNYKQARSHVAQGLRKGVSDLFLAYPAGNYHGLWVELKKDRHSYLSEEQIKWLERMADVGYDAQPAYGYKEAISIIENYLT